MKNRLTASFALVFSAVLTTPLAAQDARTPKLPGARPVIEAINYPSLQAAFDALPEDGGMVRFPAGTFEFANPLVIRAGDVCVEGAGTATHILNKNEDGKAALVLELPEAKKGGQDRLWRIRLANFRVTGNPKSGSGSVAEAINEVHLDGLTVSHHGGDGILLNHCYVGEDKLKRGENDREAAGLVLDGARDLNIAGNVLSGLRPKGVTTRNDPQNVRFHNNLLVESESDLPAE